MRQIANVKKQLLRFVRRTYVSFLGILPRHIGENLYRKSVKFPTQCPKELTFGVAQTYDEISASTKIVHDAYVGLGIKENSASGMHVTQYLTMPTSVVLVVKFKDEVIGTATIIRDSFLGLPTDSIADLSAMRARGDRIAEISGLAIHKDFSGNKRISLLLIKYLLRYIIDGNQGIDRLVISVHPKSKLFYKAIGGFEEIVNKNIVDASYMKGAPACCLTMNTDKKTFRSSLRKLYKDAPIEKNFEAFLFAPLTNAQPFHDPFYIVEKYYLSDSELKDLFICKENIFKKLKPNHKIKLANLYDKNTSFKEDILNSSPELSNISFLEKRAKSHRFTSDCPMKVVWEDKILMTNIINISETGCLLKFPHPIDETFDMAKGIVEIGPNITSKIKFKKVWTDSNGFMGVALLATDLKWKNLINYAKHIRENIAKSA